MRAWLLIEEADGSRVLVSFDVMVGYTLSHGMSMDSMDVQGHLASVVSFPKPSEPEEQPYTVPELAYRLVEPTQADGTRQETTWRG